MDLLEKNRKPDRQDAPVHEMQAKSLTVAPQREPVRFAALTDADYSDPFCQDSFLPCLRWMTGRVAPAFQSA